MKHSEAKYLGEQLLAEIAPYCQRAEIAGSVRRGKLEVKDLEIVALPEFEETQTLGLWGPIGPPERHSLLESALARQMPAGWMLNGKNGPLYKRLKHEASGMACDLYMANGRNWGGAMVIRTGPAEFSQALVTLARRMGMQVSNGYYIHKHPARVDEEGHTIPCRFGDECYSIISTPTEDEFFQALELPWIAPEERDAALIWRRIKQLGVVGT